MNLRNIAFVFLMFLMPLVSDAKINRSESAKVEFKAENPCPATGLKNGPCNGYVIDHIKPLACGGADAPSNMQWQTIADGKAKDKWERNGCANQANKGKQNPDVATNVRNKTCHVGPRGGRYTITASGRKRYGC